MSTTIGITMGDPAGIGPEIIVKACKTLGGRIAAGDLRLLGPTTVAIADRPGNRRTDTLHNIVGTPEVALLVLVPGDERWVDAP